MTKYEFTLILDGTPELTDDAADALFAAGCNDGTPGTCGGVFTIDFHREARSLEEAIRSAISAVQSACFGVACVEIQADALTASA